MKRILFSLAILAFASGALYAQDAYRVRVEQPQHGKVTVTPAIPENGMVPAGTVLNVKVDVTDPGWAFDSGYELSVSGGVFYPTYKESMVPEFTVKVDHNIMSIGASIIEADRLQGYKTIQDVVYAQPGVKPLKYDVFIPDGAKKLPCVVIIHGGGWSSNTEDIMRGLARELIKGGKYVVASIDYRWLNHGDGDKEPVQIHQLIEDCYGAILHIQEHAAEYGVNPKKIAVTGDSAGGHLSACMIDLIERVGDGGFGTQKGVYQFLPTYMPKGWTAAKAKKSLRAIQVAAPSYGVFDLGTLVRFAENYEPMGLVAITPDCNVPDAEIREVPQYMVLGTLDRTVGRKPMEEYLLRLKGKDQNAVLDIVDGASHAFFDWKPDQRTKDTFAKYGVPYAAKMRQFFDEVFY